MKLYWGKHTCAIGIHIVLEELGLAYALEEVDVKGGANTRPPFATMNPKQKIPVLIRDDGSMLTEYATIAAWLAATYRDRTALLAVRGSGAADPHVRGDGLHHRPPACPGLPFAPVLPRTLRSRRQGRPRRRRSGEGRRGARWRKRGFAILSHALGEGPWLVGDPFTIGDTALFYCARWAPEVGVTLPDPISAHLARMKARPTVAKVMQAWGES